MKPLNHQQFPYWWHGNTAVYWYQQEHHQGGFEEPSISAESFGEKIKCYVGHPANKCIEGKKKKKIGGEHFEY